MDVAEMDVAEEQPSTSGQKRRATDELELEEGGEFRHFVIKLGHQVHDNVELKSRLFDGVAIYVNGYTGSFPSD
ncbi:hypothetical protein M3Y99_00977800 [Aphelenchoides fujianensis]|nr:hypothetical protein M3Y99_00977800 [Aphelenchoides fujianensis]